MDFVGRRKLYYHSVYPDLLVSILLTAWTWCCDKTDVEKTETLILEAIEIVNFAIQGFKAQRKSSITSLC